MAKFSEITARYDAFIIDLWGVMHDGTALYPGAAEALASLAPKPVIFLSNAPRRAHKAEAVLTKLGVKREHYLRVITSGEIAFNILKGGLPPFASLTPAASGSRSCGATHGYYYLGPSKDEDILSDLPEYKNVSMDEAEFVLNTGYEQDFQPHADVIPTLKKLLERKLSLLCVNPDYEVVKQDGTHMLCAGALAQEYARMGGTVDYIGKPHANAYEAALQHLPQGATLMIGDNPETDIAGAKAAGLDSLLIAGGVLKVKHGKLLGETEARAICPHATHVLPHFQI
jgi:HAD superfamily hydrolase (TIGR01459 family)